MSNFVRLTNIICLTMGLAACSAIGDKGHEAAGASAASSSAKNAVAAAAGSASAAVAPDLSCLDTKVDYVLNTDVVDFEMQGGGGLNAGFSPTGVALTNLNIGVNYSQGQLQTMMHLQDPLKPGVPIADVGGSATARNITFSTDFTVSLLTLGTSFWSSTPVSQLSANAIFNNLTALGQNLKVLDQEEWWTTITQLNGDQGFFVPVGSNAGVVVGDVFKVMDARYVWAGDGTPCKNEFIMALENSAVPKAFARATKVGVDYTYFQVLNASGPLNVHDYVTVGALLQSDSVKNNKPLRQMLRSIRIGSINSKPLVFVGQGNLTSLVDISPYVLDQIKTLLPEQQFGGFYVHQ